MEGVAEVTVDQEYVNKEEKAVQAIYYFPLEEGTALTKLEAEVEGRRKVVSKVKKEEKAREVYHQTTARGRTVMVEEDVKVVDLVELKVGTLAPGVGCKVSVTYLVEANVEEEKTRLVLPSSLVPKYRPFTTDCLHPSCGDSGCSDPAHPRKGLVWPVQEIISSLRNPDPSPPLSLRLEVVSKSPILSVASASHSLNTSQEDFQDGTHSVVAHFQGTAVDMDRGMVVLVSTENGHRPRLLVERGEHSTAVLLTLLPRLEDLIRVPSEIIFLVDCPSWDEYISIAKEALSLLLDSLPKESTFNIVRLSSRVEQLFPVSQAFTDSTLEDAKTLVNNLETDRGDPKISEALQTIFHQPQKEDRPRKIFVIMGPSTSWGRERERAKDCIELVRGKRKNTRVFTLGIGKSADQHLVKELAKAGGGTACIVTERDEQLKEKVEGQLGKVLAPSLYPVMVDWELGVKSDNGQHCQVPPQIVHGSRLSVFHCFDGKIEEGVEAILTTGDTKQKVAEEKSLTGELLHKMFAMKMMQELEGDIQGGTKEEDKKEKDKKKEDKKEKDKSKEEDKNKKEKKEQIKDLSVKYGIVSPFTTLVGVEEGTGKKMGEMVVRRVDNMWHTRSSNVPRFLFTRNNLGWRPDLCLSTEGHGWTW